MNFKDLRNFYSGGIELHGKTLGIIGFGKIGQAVARRATGFGLNIIYYNRSITSPDSSLKQYVKPVGLNELLKTSDYLSIHLPLTDETRGFIDRQTINKMKTHFLSNIHNHINLTLWGVVIILFGSPIQIIIFNLVDTIYRGINAIFQKHYMSSITKT